MKFANQAPFLQKNFSYANRFSADFAGGELRIPPEQLESISIPGKAINTFEYPIDGWKHLAKMPGGYFFEDITLNIRETDYKLYEEFKKWQDRVIDPKTYKLYYASNYEHDGSISQLDKKGIPIKTVWLEGVYPIGINNIEFSSTSENTITSISVTLTIKNMT